MAGVIRMFVFETSHHALWAEQVAEQRGVTVQVVPAPEGAEAQCGLALRIEAGDEEALAAALADEGITFRRFPEH